MWIWWKQSLYSTVFRISTTEATPEFRQANQHTILFLVGMIRFAPASGRATEMQDFCMACNSQQTIGAGQRVDQPRVVCHILLLIRYVTRPKNPLNIFWSFCVFAREVWHIILLGVGLQDLEPPSDNAVISHHGGVWQSDRETKRWKKILNTDNAHHQEQQFCFQLCPQPSAGWFDLWILELRKLVVPICTVPISGSSMWCMCIFFHYVNLYFLY